MTEKEKLSYNRYISMRSCSGGLDSQSRRCMSASGVLTILLPNQHDMPLELVAHGLGHRNSTTTLVYAYANTEHKCKAIEKAMEHSRATTGLSVSSRQQAYRITDEELLKCLYGLD